MTTSRTLKLALIERGNPSGQARHNPRLEPIFTALEDFGATTVPILYSETIVDQVRAQLLNCDGVLVWVNPVADGVDRTELDQLLRDVASVGVWVSAHPDVILKMGVKAVLARTKTLGWGSDAHCYDSIQTFRRQFPVRLAADGVRVLKPNRGNGSQGVLKVALTTPNAFATEDSPVTIVEARGDVTEAARLGDLLDRYDSYLATGGPLVDQDLQQRVGEGLVRCYMCQDTVVGFSEQLPRIKALGHASPAPFGMASDKIMHDETEPRFQGLRRSMQIEWTPGLQALLDIHTAALPVLWDADFFYGPKTRDGQNSFVLCEINISCVLPFPPTAADRIAAATIAQASAFKAAFVAAHT